MTQRIRSYSLIKKNIDTSNGLVRENSILKDRVHQMKFLVEDNLDILINELDQDLRQQAQLTDMSNIFLLIKDNIERWKQQIQNQKSSINTFETQFEKLKAIELSFKQQYETDRLADQNKHQQVIKQKETEINNLTTQILELQNKLQINEIQLEEQITQRDQILKQQHSQLRSKIQELEQEIQQNKQQHNFEIQAMIHNHEKDRKFFKEELDNQIIQIEQKYKKYLLENQQLMEKQQKNIQQLKQLKQQKEGLEKQLESQSSKHKQYVDELANERKSKAKEAKVQNEQYEIINQLQGKLGIEEKRVQRLKEQIGQLQETNQNLIQQHQIDSNELNQQINSFQKQLQIKEQYILDQQKSYIQQIQIQKIKYEKLLGNNVAQYEEMQNLTKDFGEQYDDQKQIDYIKSLECKIKELENQIFEKNKLIQQITTKHEKLQQSLQNQIDQKLKEVQQEHKQQIQKITQEFEFGKDKLIVEHNYKINLLQQQLSFEVDKITQELKESQRKNQLLVIELQEKEQLIVYLSEQNQEGKENLEKEKKQGLVNIQNLKLQAEQQIDQLKQDYNNKIGELTSQITTLTNQNESMTQQYQQIVKNNSDIRNELKEQKSQTHYFKVQSDRLAKELQIQIDIIKSLNDRIRQYQVEVENAKQTYNIFTKTQRIPGIMSSEIRFTKLRTSPMNRKLRSISNTRLQQLQNL